MTSSAFKQSFFRSPLGMLMLLALTILVIVIVWRSMFANDDDDVVYTTEVVARTFQFLDKKTSDGVPPGYAGEDDDIPY